MSKKWQEEGDPEALIDITDILDEGASSAVFRGVYKNTQVAVKVIPGLDDPSLAPEIVSEIKLLRKTVGSNFLCGFFGSWEKENHAWVVLEFCEGGSIIDLCNICQTTMKPVELQAICGSVLLALKFLQENHNIIHRDVKGKNILLTKDGRVKLTDLGIAIEMQPFIQPAGSPHWMAPETALNITCFANDIWSLGITIIELAEGEPPYADIEPTQVLTKIACSPPPEFASDNKHRFGPLMISFLAACTTKDHNKRPTAAALLKHPFVDGAIMHLMVSDKPEPSLQTLLQRALPAVESYRNYTRGHPELPPDVSAAQEEEVAPPKPPGSPTKKMFYSEADDDLIYTDEARKSLELSKFSTTLFEKKLKDINADRDRKRVQSVKRTEKLNRVSNRNESPEKAAAMQNRLKQLQTNLEKNASKLKRFLPKT